MAGYPQLINGDLEFFEQIFIQRTILAHFGSMNLNEQTSRRRKHQHRSYAIESEEPSQGLHDQQQAMLIEAIYQEPNPKSSKKYQHYIQLMKKMGDYDWTNLTGENNKLVYPIQFLTAAGLQFMICAQYFNGDQEHLKNSLAEVQKSLKKINDLKFEKRGYDYRKDEFIMEMRNLQLKPLDDLISLQEDQLAQLERQNHLALEELGKIEIPQPLVVDQTIFNGLLRDIAGLTEAEKQYIEKIENKLQDLPPGEVDGKTHKQQNGGITLQANVDDALCQVCNDGDYTDDNLIVFCSKCNISVHQKCYLIEIIPNEDWICDVCQTFGASGQFLRCALCPRLGGAMKATRLDASAFQSNNQSYYEAYGENMMKNDLVTKLFQEQGEEELYYDFMRLPNRTFEDLGDIKEPQPQKAWVHLSCFLFTPECYLDEKTNMFKGIELIPARRFQNSCNICNIKRAGVALNCGKQNCPASYHVECARRAGIFTSITVTNSKPDYQLFCHKHVPLKVKRILEAKNRQYEREIMEFFRCYEKCRQIYKKGFKKPKAKKQLPPPAAVAVPPRKDKDVKEQDENEFAFRLKQFIDQINRYKIVVTIEHNQVKHVSEPLIKPNKKYELKDVPQFLQNRIDHIAMNILPFYKSTITSTDEIWSHFKFKDYDIDLTYKMYERIRRRAGRYMQELNPHKKQAKLVDLLMLKKLKKGRKAEEKKQIIVEMVGDLLVTRDENLYCFCRDKFKEGEVMICCDTCEEWYHFECLGLLKSEQEAKEMSFICFLCQDELPPEEQERLQEQNRAFYKDPLLKFQREFAQKTNLAEIRARRLLEIRQQALQEQEQEQEQEPAPEQQQAPQGEQQHVKTPSKTESVEEVEHKQLEIVDANEQQQQQRSQRLKQTSLEAFFRRK